MDEKILDEWRNIYKEFSKKFFDNDDIGFAKNFPPPHVRADIEALLFKEEATEEEILSLPTIMAANGDIQNSIKDMIESAKKSVAVRKDWAAALRAAKRGSALSSVIKWGFMPGDIKELARLHKANKFRKKIEDLLEDCNFHEECSDFCAKDYSAYL